MKKNKEYDTHKLYGMEEFVYDDVVKKYIGFDTEKYNLQMIKRLLRKLAFMLLIPFPKDMFLKCFHRYTKTFVLMED